VCTSSRRTARGSSRGASPATDPGQFSIPHNICCDADGWVYVSDRENHRVQVFDGNGKYETQWANMGRPSSLYLERGPQGRFYIGDVGGGVAVAADQEQLVLARDRKPGACHVPLSNQRPHELLVWAKPRQR
jgi:DNA-binding beta-propeller fold protein YncE